MEPVDLKDRLLDNWIVQDVGALFASVKRYSHFVGGAKFVLGAIATLLLIALSLWPVLNPIDQPIKLTFTPVEVKDVEVPKMVNPRFHGVDAKNHPFNLIADEGVQESPEIATLKNLSGDTVMNGETWVSFKADSGVMHVKGKLLDLSGNVNVFTDKGYELSTTSAHLDLKKGSATGEEPITIQGLPGVLKADNFEFLDKGDNLFFHGHVNLVIHHENNATAPDASKIPDKESKLQVK